MKKTIQIISWISLIVMISSVLMFFTGAMSDLDTVKNIMIFTTIVWFVTAPLWMNRERQ